MTQKQEKSNVQDVKEVKAYVRGVHIAPRKVRIVTRVLKNMPVDEALTQLNFLTKKSAQPIKKLVNSAVANAAHNFQIEKERLFVKSFTVDGGRVFLRYEPRAQGRAFPVRKRTSNLNLVLGVSKVLPKSQKKAVSAKTKEEIVEAKPEAAPVDAERKKSRFSFWRRLSRDRVGKKQEDTSQIPPKQDVKGKHYTSFDRRGNM